MNNRTQPYYNNSLAIRQEIQRFESVHPSIYAIYDLLEVIPDPLLAQQIREHVVCIEVAKAGAEPTTSHSQSHTIASFDALTCSVPGAWQLPVIV
ncbi:hypothetical protein HPB52_025431 [Rhipicephalus sanguineus]|uniref:Uncharacterized protein n=1 Tax=Rhipicephalus sanguineus TaxID=34632 RepID=A0A9D4PBA3_RHISA|nr:hypothetical protein HPB52_025431 [Rhipicephalus sanguineus]